MPTRGLALTKRALNATFENNLADQLDMEEKFKLLPARQLITMKRKCILRKAQS